MNTVILLTRDRIFGRMLALELQDAGIHAEICAAMPSLHSQGSLTVAADSETAAALKGELSADIEFGFDETPVGKCRLYLRRPFVTEKFISAVSEISTEKEKASEDEKLCGSELPFDSGLVLIGSDFFYNGIKLKLTEKEQALLSALYQNRGETISREELLSSVWGRECDGHPPKTNLTDVYIRYLREKLDERFSVRLICNVRGKGYKLN